MEKQEILNKFNSQKTNQLIISLIIDAVGVSSFLIPALGEISDIVIAPISAIAVYMVHKTRIGAFVDFTEELLPATDIIPTATLIWYNRYQMNKEKTLRKFISSLHEDAEIENKIFNEQPKRIE